MRLWPVSILMDYSFYFSEKCTAGYASMSGFVPCYPCPIGTYQPDDGKSACIKCPQGADTMTSASTNSSYCESKINILSSTYSILYACHFFTNDFKMIKVFFANKDI